MKKLLLALALFSLLATMIVACGGSGTSSSTDAPNTIHASDIIFLQDHITIKKGDSITLVNDSATPHIIANGTWDNSNPESLKEPGAPAGVELQSNETKTIGPFDTAGVFHLYCTIHPNMNLTVTVK